MAELLEKYEQAQREKARQNSRIMEQGQEKNVPDRIIGSTKKTAGTTTTSAQQKIDPVITTKEVAVTTEIDREMNLRSSKTLLANAQDKGVQTTVPITRRRGKCTNCCGGLPGCGPGHGRGCEGKCTCIPGLRIREKGFCDEEDFVSNSMEKIQLPRLFVTRHRGNRLRGGGAAAGDGTCAKDPKKTKIPRICRRKEKIPSLPTETSLQRTEQGSASGAKERRLSRGFRRSLSSLRGQLARWEEARESCWESCPNGGQSQTGKNWVGRASISAECVPTSYNHVIGVLPGISKRSRNFRRKQNVMATAVAAGWPGGSGNLCRGTTDSPLLALSVPTPKCVRKGLVDLVGDKCRECLAWETTSLASDERGWSDSSSRGNFELFSVLGSKILKGTGHDCPDGYSLNIEAGSTTWSTSDVRKRTPMENRFYLPLEIMIRVRRSKNWRNYNFSKQWRALKFKRNDQERLRGGGSTLDLISVNKLQRDNDSKNQSSVDIMADIEITPLYRNQENNVTNVARSERTNEDECPWSRGVTNERVFRLQEDQEYHSGPEHRNEDRRIRGGCGGSYKSLQHSLFSSNVPTIWGRRDSQYPRSPCCSQTRPQVSYRSAPPPRPPPCPRSQPVCAQARCQNHGSYRHMDHCNEPKGCCPCNACGGAACNDNSDFGEMDRCCRPQQREQYPCQCRCQTCKGFRSCGGCGGHLCGTIYSCSGSGGGTCCFPRNTRKRSGPECCGGGSSNCGGCC